MDAEDPTKFKVLVRSSKEIPHMSKIDPETFDYDSIAEMNSPSSKTNEPRSNNHTGNKKRISTSFLSPCEKSSFWQITLKLENSHTARLGVTHIEARRQALTMEKKKILSDKLQLFIAKSSINR